jgi:two-component system, OmpR family, sensor histidine kinase BaeS
MKIGITYRLFFSILSATGLAILFLFLIMWWNIDRGFYQYLGTLDQGRLVKMAGSLEQAYAEHGSWSFLRDSPGLWIGRLLNVPPENEALSEKVQRSPDRAGGERTTVSPSSHANHSRGPLVILDAERKSIFGFLAEGDEANFQPIVYQGTTVGYIGLLSPKHFLHPVQVRFLGQQRLALALAALGMVIVVIIVSLPLARRLVKPMSAMAAATHDIASGRYATRIPVSSSDELGRLARDFNDMAATLEKHEKERRQWVADISHELRTPVSVLRGEIEALLDGIRTITPETIRSLHAETLRLSRLLEDLYQLSLSDMGALTYRKEDLDLTEVLEVSIETYRAEFARKDIRLRMDIAERPAIRVFADRERMHQLFANLLDNSLKYTDRGGELIIRLTYHDSRAAIDFEDSPPGVPGAELERLFDRLYRVEESRNRLSGGAGLGLAICRNIAEGHDGTIAAYPSSLGGLMITVTIPASGRSL